MGVVGEMRGVNYFALVVKIPRVRPSFAQKTQKTAKKSEKNRNVLLFIRENKGPENTIFVIIGKTTLKKRVRKQKENKLRIFFGTLKVQNV